MNKSDILELIRNGENSFVEFKRDDVKPIELAKEIVAFANYKGGKVLLGVEDDGTVSGVNKKKLEAWDMNSISDNVTPYLIPYYENVEIKNRCNVIVAGVDCGLSKPYGVKRKGKLYYYIRVGSESKDDDREQLRRLFQSSGDVRFEITPVSSASFEELDFRRI